ncbi:hypothetical protein [Anditalea andensis]|uniref:Potassium channel protein n=1 Tax=Anditalea andensis TaxID=1048983 RepID=A0A074KWM4_9BACT|nr:hypothetical protein [Anditalea andensis]KEO73354.1 hypothetical protein EL17_13490 [Anditalea andensis]
MNMDIKASKGRIIEAVNACDNPYLLLQMEKLLKREGMLGPIGEMVAEFPVLLEEEPPRDKIIQTHLSAPDQNKLSRYDSIATPIFFFLGLIMLMLAAAILNAISQADVNLNVAIFQGTVVRMYLFGWLVYVGDFIVLLVLARQTHRKLATGEFIFRVAALLFPPMRMASRHIQQVELIWIPLYGWSLSNEGLLKLIKRKFSIPMIVIALLIIPVLLIEWQFYDQVSAYLNTDLTFLLDLVQAFIWMAFASEFILMISISNEKVEYAQKNWIDIAIILLPFISFVRTIRIFKIARLTQLARGYKLRGLLMKARQGFVFASFFYRILTIKPDFQINRLRKQLVKNQKEREMIEEDLIELYKALKMENKI